MTDHPAATDIAGPIADADEGWEWAIVEIFGHRSHAGRTREEERFGAKMLRIDVPIHGNPENEGWLTHYYGGASIFSFTLATEEKCIKANKPYVSAFIARHDPDDSN